MATGAFSDKSRDSSVMEMKIGGYHFKKSMKLEGIGKLVYLTVKPHLSTEDCPVGTEEDKGEKIFEKFTLNFGTVAVGRMWEMAVKVSNTSEVRVAWKGGALGLEEGL